MRESAGRPASDGEASAPSGPRSIVALVVSVALPFAVGGLGGLLTARAIPDWYDTLAKPVWTPPSWVFGPAWSTLYLLMGIAAWRVWRRQAAAAPDSALRSAGRSALVAYAIQLGLNGVWTPVFFGLRLPGLALAVILALLVAILETLRRFGRVDRPAAVLLLPYLAWVAFATALNGEIWRLNR
jgi:translocator protein